MKNALIGISFVIVMAIAGVFGYSHLQPQSFGSFNPTGGGTYTLQSSISSTQTSITLTSFTEPVSNIPYTMSYIGSNIIYGTIAPSTGNSEFIAATGITQNTNGTATLTGVVRGQAKSPGTGGCVASTTLARAWPGQTQFILANTPCFYSQYAVKQNDETISGLYTFTQPPVGINPGGSPNASYTVNGLVQLATARQAASSTVNGSSGAADVLRSSYATDTPGMATTSVVMSLMTGKIGQLWLDLTQAFTFSGGLTVSSGTTTASGNTSIAGTGANPLRLNGIYYNFPASLPAVNTFWRNDGIGGVSAGMIAGLLSTSTTPVALTGGTASTTVFSTTVPANALLSGAVTVTLHISVLSIGNGNAIYACALYGSNPSCFSLQNGTGAGLSSTQGTFTVTLYGGSATNSQKLVETIATQAPGVPGTPTTGTAISTENMQATTIGTDSTSAQTLSVVARLSNSADNFTVQDYIATLNR